MPLVNDVNDLAELELSELEAILLGAGSRPFHAGQILRWIYQRGSTTFDQMTDLSLGLRKQLEATCVVTTPRVEHREVSEDGTEKFLLRLQDDSRIESVFIPDTPRLTFCVSTQVGCTMRCGFCLTGKMGLTRNLTAGEIVGQVRVLAHTLDLVDTPFNIVLMGMGEPLHNYDATMKALRMLTVKCGMAVPPRRITLSTVGVPAGLEKLATEPVLPNLAVSLHAPTEELRAQLVPVNQRYGLAEIIDACRRFPATRRHRITFEYVLLAGVNDSTSQAARLATLVGSLQAKVNVIPLNEAPGLPYRRPSDGDIDRFARVLANRGITVSVRKSRGRDIRAACGQLIVEGAAPSPAQAMADRLSSEARFVKSSGSSARPRQSRSAPST